MQLARARIRNFRSLKDVTVDFATHTAFIGGNGAGKSSILKAIEKFYASGKVLDADDWYARDTNQPVEIELTFTSLSDEEAETFESRVRDGRLTVTRVFDGGQRSGRYHGSVRLNPDFKAIRDAPNATEKRKAYAELRTINTKYADLPVAGSGAAVDDVIKTWELNNPNDLALMRDDGQFFGFQNAGRGALQRHTSFVFIPRCGKPPRMPQTQNPAQSSNSWS